MKLRDKFKKYTPIEFEEECSDECEQIADDYAIEFAEWIDKNHKLISIEIYSNKKELLEIFKKEKGL